MSRPKIFLYIAIAGAHLFIFFFHFHPSSPPLPKKSIVVRTFVPPPPKHKRTPNPIQKSAAIPSSRGQTSKKSDLLKELAKTFDPIEPTPPPSSTLTPPSRISSLDTDTVEKEIKGDYPILLASTLKNTLELPEVGEVKLELTVRRSGQVMKVRVLHAASEKNRRYLEINLPQMALPPFGDEMKQETSHTFILTFCNET